MKKLIIMLILSVGLISLTSCKENTENEVSKTIDPNTYTVTFTDDLDRTITVSDPERVATLLGSFADIWTLSGGTVAASADDAWNDFDIDMPKDAINLGKNKTLSLESLYAADPDFVIGSTNIKLDMEWLDTLEESGITTAYFDVTDFDDYLRVLKIFTEINQRPDLFDKYGTSIQQRINDTIDASKERIKKHGAPTVLYLRTSASGIRVKKSEGTVLGEMLSSLGCINIADSNKSLLENLSLEKILEIDPDYIFMVQMGDDDEAAARNIKTTLYDNPAWNSLSAVKEEKVFILEKELYNLKPNDRWAESYEKLEKILSDEEN